MKMKTISYYVGGFLLAILVFLFAGILLLQCTIFQESFMISAIEKSNFVKELYETTEEEFSYYILQSGLSEEVLDGLISEDKIREELFTYLHNFYEGGSLAVSTEQLKIQLEENIVAYLNQNHLTVSDESSLDLFVDEILNTYQKNMEDSFLFGMIQTPFIKIKNMLPIMLLILGITIVLISLILKFGTRRNVLGIPFLTSGMLYGGLFFYLSNSLDMQNFYVYNTAFSNLMKTIYSSLSSCILGVTLFFLILGLLSSLLGKVLVLKQKKKKEVLP